MKVRKAKGAGVDTLLREVATLAARLAEAENTIISLRMAARGGSVGISPAVSAPKKESRLESMVRERTREHTVLIGELHAEIRERMLAEEKLLAEKSYREAVENCLAVGIAATDLKGRHIHVNDAFCTLTGFRRVELMGVGMPYPYWHPADGKAFTATLRKMFKGAIPPGGIEFRFLTRDGQSLDVLFHLSRLTVAGKVAGFLASVNDITERKRIESALWESEGRFRSLVRDLPIGICILQDGRLVFANPEQEKLLCPVQESDLPARPLNIHPEDAEAFEALCRSVTFTDNRTKEADLRLLLGGAGDATDEFRWVRCKAGNIQYQGRDAVLLSMMDITRAMELEGIVMVREKLASLGQLSAGIAHEIRNPLSGINIYLSALGKFLEELVETDSGDRERIRLMIDQMKTASEKISSVIKRVMDFSRPTSPRLGFADMNRVVEEAVRISQAGLRENGVALSEKLARDLPECRADPRLIEQVLLNLISNAVQAMGSREGPRQIEIASTAEEGRIVLRVSDSGPGVPTRFRTRIFDPFFTTRKDGYGIGLSFSHRIVSDHGGSLTVGKSRWGGAEFRIELPIEKEASTA